jgi:peptidoglycan/xylan/chitin deacetylase (PgdA/CDA1 family)
VQAAVTASGYRHVGWHVGVEDWDPARGAAVIEEDLVAGTLAHGDGTVILVHAWPRQTLEALPGTLGRLREAGATFVRIDRLDEVPAAPNWA